jgi:hypothetical protein
MIFGIFWPQNLAVLTKNTVNLLLKIYNNIGFREKRQFFRRKMAKIAENFDHNIDPRFDTCRTHVCRAYAVVELKTLAPLILSVMWHGAVRGRLPKLMLVSK